MTALAIGRHALAIWNSAVAAVRPEPLLEKALAANQGRLHHQLLEARRIVVVGAGKASGAMAAALEQSLPTSAVPVTGWVNVPDDCVHALDRIHLHASRPAGINQPTASAWEGTRQILQLIDAAEPEDIAVCLLSGGGSALLPAPVEGVSLEALQQTTAALHACGATIAEMNAVRKHLSRVAGGRLAERFQGRALISLIISDVVGDPLDVIASGLTAPDPTTYADALGVLGKYRLLSSTPDEILQHLRAGAAGLVPETPKVLPLHVENTIVGNNQMALAAAAQQAVQLGYRVLDLGAFIQGETREVARCHAGIIRSIQRDGTPMGPPACLLSGGETTVTLHTPSGKGGRNQEFVLAAALELGRAGLHRAAVLSGGTDGEDGPTDAAGALVNEELWLRAEQRGLDANSILRDHNSYLFHEATGGLLKTGLTQTNVMDVRVLLVR